MARRFVNFDFTAQYFFEGPIKISGTYQPLVAAISIVLVEWLLLALLYRKRIFLRV